MSSLFYCLVILSQIALSYFLYRKTVINFFKNKLLSFLSSLLGVIIVSRICYLLYAYNNPNNDFSPAGYATFTTALFIPIILIVMLGVVVYVYLAKYRSK